ncbi:MAG TPA: DUF3500 domain-containing protein [Gemmatimonadaceae bacterium]|nr:DUF3500 domain-containing protein [Gemmatimonadaceae bacterium]
MIGSRRALPFILPLACAAALAGSAVPRGQTEPEPIAPVAEYEFVEMLTAADAFLASLSAAQRSKALFAFDDAERLNWHFVPRARRGLPLKEMSAEQRELARGILRAGLSRRGYLTASTIIDLELILRELGENPTFRDPELYYFSVFGTPSRTAAWGFRAEGHHLSLNFTLVRDTLIAVAPAFFGANPAEVRGGTRKGLRALADEEDIGRELVLSLDERQRARAIISAEAPRDIVTGNTARVEPLSPTGIPVTELRPEQGAILVRLLDVYLGRMADPLAARRRAALERTDFAKVAFAWAGSTRRGEAHYYRIQGPSFLVEYDNTQNGANHIHTVWRDFDGDFGRDLLREHYRSAGPSHGH